MPSTSGLSPIKCEFELEAGQDGAQIVADAGQHRGALLDRALDARLHFQERLRRLPHFPCAAGTEVRRLAALAEAFGGVRQPQDRPDLVAQEQHRDDQEDRGGAEHPEDEDLRIGGVGRAALREHAHHGIIELDAYFNQLGVADGIDPERAADLAADLRRQGLVEQREERLRPRLRHVADREKIDHELQPLPDEAQLRALLVLRIELVDVDQAGDVPHHGCRQAPRHRIPVPLHEHERHDRLQDHHRHDHDQERAGIEAGRHPALERVAHPAIGPGDALRRIADERQAGVERAHSEVWLRATRPGDSRCRAPPAGTADWRDRARSCAAGG